MTRSSLRRFACAVAAVFLSNTVSPAARQEAALRGTPIDESYRLEFARCDKEDRFYSFHFPMEEGKKHWYACSSNPSRLRRLEKVAETSRAPAAVIFEAKLAHDLDGSPAACTTPGHTDQCGTALMLKPSAQQPCPEVLQKDAPYCLPVNAAAIPYIVLPASGPKGMDRDAFARKTAIAVGDVGMVIWNDRRVPVLVADTGPSYKVGEGSSALLQQLSANGAATPIDAGVLFVVFPGSRFTRDTPADSLGKLVNDRANALYACLVGQTACTRRTPVRRRQDKL